MRVQRKRDSGGKCMHRAYPHVTEDSAKIQRSTDNGIAQGEEFADAI